MDTLPSIPPRGSKVFSFMRKGQRKFLSGALLIAIGLIAGGASAVAHLFGDRLLTLNALQKQNQRVNNGVELLFGIPKASADVPGGSCASGAGCECNCGSCGCGCGCGCSCS